MLVRFILTLIAVWFVMTVIRAAVQGARPRNPHYRRPGAGSLRDERRRALKVLGLYDGAKAADIKKAYRDMAAKYHPDRVAHLGPEMVELASEKFKEINAAYEYLNGR